MVLLPQAFRAVIIPLGSVLIALTKNTTIASAIGVAEAALLMKEMIENTAALLIVGNRLCARVRGVDVADGVVVRLARQTSCGGPMSGASVLFDAPGPRARVRNQLITAVTVAVVAVVAWVVYSRLQSKGQLTSAKWEPFLTGNLWKTYILTGYRGHVDRGRGLDRLGAAVSDSLLGVGRLSATQNAVRWVVLGGRGVLPLPCPC